MKYIQTKNINESVTFREAVLKGIASDGGLFMPSEIPVFHTSFFNSLVDLSFIEISYEVAKRFVGDEIKNAELLKIIRESMNFPAPVKRIGAYTNVLELFHGPTLAFKDFGARFMAKILSFFHSSADKDLYILVATSGDTGSAVANAFLNEKGIKVILLYPSGKVSKIQEQQLTTLGNNITAVEILGNFDDCQRLVKSAFADSILNSRLNLTSANSINIARLIPQSFYYFSSYADVAGQNESVVFSVPSGNLGNLTGGLIAYKMGLPVKKFIAAVNSNKVIPDYLHTGTYSARNSVKTISNAMDVGDPSNFARVKHLFNGDHSLISKVIYSNSFSDDETLKGISEGLRKYNYVFDPHGCVGWLALEDYRNKTNDISEAVILETAHPAKFSDVLPKQVEYQIEMPERLKSCLTKEKKTIILSSEYQEFRDYLFSL